MIKEALEVLGKVKSADARRAASSSSAAMRPRPRSPTTPSTLSPARVRRIALRKMERYQTLTPVERSYLNSSESARYTVFEEEMEALRNRLDNPIEKRPALSPAGTHSGDTAAKIVDRSLGRGWSKAVAADEARAANKIEPESGRILERNNANRFAPKPSAPANLPGPGPDLLAAKKNRAGRGWSASKLLSQGINFAQGKKVTSPEMGPNLGTTYNPVGPEKAPNKYSTNKFLSQVELGLANKDVSDEEKLEWLNTGFAELKKNNPEGAQALEGMFGKGEGLDRYRGAVERRGTEQQGAFAPQRRVTQDKFLKGIRAIMNSNAPDDQKQAAFDETFGVYKKELPEQAADFTKRMGDGGGLDAVERGILSFSGPDPSGTPGRRYGDRVHAGTPGPDRGASAVPYKRYAANPRVSRETQVTEGVTSGAAPGESAPQEQPAPEKKDALQATKPAGPALSDRERTITGIQGLIGQMNQEGRKGYTYGGMSREARIADYNAKLKRLRGLDNEQYKDKKYWKVNEYSPRRIKQDQARFKWLDLRSAKADPKLIAAARREYNDIVRLGDHGSRKGRVAKPSKPVGTPPLTPTVGTQKLVTEKQPFVPAGKAQDSIVTLQPDNAGEKFKFVPKKPNQRGLTGRQIGRSQHIGTASGEVNMQPPTPTRPAPGLQSSASGTVGKAVSTLRKFKPAKLDYTPMDQKGIG